MKSRIPFSRSFVFPSFALLLFVLVFALFSPSVRYGFVDIDDHVYVTGNRFVLSGLSSDSIRAAFAAPPSDVGMYMPLLWVSYMADVSLFGASPSNPAPFHAVNVVLHAANAVLFFILLLRLIPGRSPGSILPLLLPFLLALLWAVHPLRVESVAWVTERKDTLSLFFALLSILAYLRAGASHGTPDAPPPPSAPPESGSGKRALLFAPLSFLCFAAALLVKPTLVPFPVLFVFLDLLVFRRPFSIRLVLGKTHFFLLSAAAVIATLAGHRQPIASLSFPARLALVPQTLLHYLGVSCFPRHLAPLDPGPAFALLPALADALLLGAFILIAFRLRYRAPAVSLGICWFFLFLLPVSGLAVIPNNAVADRFSYVPALGLSIALLGVSAPSPAGLSPPRLLRPLCIILLAACVGFASLAFRVLPNWRSSDALFARVRCFRPLTAFVALHDAQSAITRSGDFQAARDIALRAFRVNPSSPQLLFPLAAAIAHLEGPGEAFDFLHAHPPAVPALRGIWAWHLAHLSLRLDRPDEALAFADLAESLLPPHYSLHGNIRALRTAVASSNPADALPHYLAQWAACERDDALGFFRRFAAGNSSHPDTLANIAWILSTADWSPAPPSEALDLATRALSLAPEPPPPALLDTYAAALANASDFSAAAAAQERAISLLPPSSPSLPDYQSRLDLYRQSKPFREAIDIVW